VIAPRTLNDANTGSDLVDLTDRFFRPGGILQTACANEPFPYEPRPQQADMAKAVAQAIEAPTHLAVEAGTGVGKSFAYLVPLIIAAVQKQIQVVASTYTIALQEQLIRKDIPFLQQHIGFPFRAVLVKGRSNYLCLRRLARARRLGPELFRDKVRDELEQIRAWADHTADGSLQSMDHQPSPEVWSSVCAEQGNCLGRKCPEYGRCFLMKARADVRTAHLLVVNHHLLFSELALRTKGAAFLPPYRLAVLDEAHMIEGVASEHMGLRLSHYAFEHWLRRLFTPDTGKGLLAVVREGQAAHVVTELWSEVEKLYASVRRWADLSEDRSQKVVVEPLQVETRVAELIAQLTTDLRRITENTKDEDVRAELKSARNTGAGLKDELEAFLSQSLHDQVYWIEREGRRRQQTVFYSAPIEVAPILEKTLFAEIDSVIMTSATLAVGDSLDYFIHRVGADECETSRLGSPFNYERQMRIYIPRGLPDPTDSANFAPAAAKAILHFTHKSRGNAFVLFTSAHLMRTVGGLVAEEFNDFDLELLVQGEGLPKHKMLERFREGGGYVLFGLDSFWMGVDVRGSALSNVIITRLPFAVPDQPLTQARMDRIRERGGDPFRDYSLPEAILKFRQGVGRLIRTATDEGMVVVLDNRIISKWYGKLFLRSIPECPVEVVELPEK
jgi:ATP-dependent DNA helicase DinG